MAAEKKRNRIIITSAKGTFQWPKLTRIDYGTDKFPSPDGSYNTKVIFSLADAAVQKMIATLQPHQDAAVAAGEAAFKELKVEVRKRMKAITIHPLYNEEYDEVTEEPTGNIIMKFAMKAGGVRKKDGTRWSQSPGLFDALGKPLPKGIDIWGGTEGKIAFEIEPFFIEGTGLTGISTRLQAVQVIELVSQGTKSASAFGFGEEEGFDSSGFEPEQPTMPEGDDTTGSTDDGADADRGNF